LSWYFSAPCTRREFLRIRTGSTIPHLNCGDVIEMQVPVPPMEQQRKMADQIADYRSNTLRLGEVVKRKLSAIARLRTSLLNSAFTGDL
jgi:type I restriction enzyme, S subunit